MLDRIGDACAESAIQPRIEAGNRGQRGIIGLHENATLFGQLEIGLDNYSTLPLELALIDSTLPAAEEKEEPVKEPSEEED